MIEQASIVGPGRRARGCDGVVLLVLLLALALGGIALMAAVDVASIARQRAREQELLFVGDQYRQAIRRYYYAAPNGAKKVLPASLYKNFKVVMQDADPTGNAPLNDMKKVLFTVNFDHLGIFKITPDAHEAHAGSIRRVKVEMYCEKLDLKFDDVGKWA